MASDEEALTLRVPTDLYRQIRKRADLEDRSMSSLIRVAIRAYLAAKAADRG